MNVISAKEQISVYMPKLATLVLIFWGLSANTHLDAAPSWQLQAGLLPHAAPQKNNTFDIGDDQIHVLPARDAALYRAAFAAQEKADWAFADKALAQIKDKRLVGHVLADRYMRRNMTLDEAKQWLASYSDLPEAATLYDQATLLRGFNESRIAPPQTSAAWQGNNGYSPSSGFRSVNDNDGPSGAASVPREEDAVSRVAAAFYYQGEIERARAMARKAAESGVPLGLWIEGLSAWKQQDFGTASFAFAKLAQTEGLSSWDHAAASYWAYRAANRQGDKGEAHRWLAEASKSPRSFYGAMAARLIGHRPARSWNMPELNAGNIALLAARPAGEQALALVQVGRSDLAENELRGLLSAGSHKMQTAVLALAEKARMPSLILQLSGVATHDNGQPFDAALYPLPPWQPTGGFKVDRALIYALMRHESQFNPEAVSWRGACGLMQIMPSTARHISNENKAERADADCPDRLFDPVTNIDLGQKYVRVLAGQPRIGNNLLLLLAAYNGGPGNLAHWLDGTDRADPLLFIESLPVRETRDYVQQVLLQYWMYRARLSEPETAIAQLARGEWPRYALRDEGAPKRADAQGLELASLEPVRMNGTR